MLKNEVAFDGYILQKLSYPIALLTGMLGFSGMIQEFEL